jgi:peptidoglycan/xylan/chitin deacetylase (PgdA/CDA1 family)
MVATKHRLGRPIRSSNSSGSGTGTGDSSRFRPGHWQTVADRDDVAARIVTAMGDRLVSFSVNGDGGATFTPGQVRGTVAASPGGSIVICHMNHPESGTAQGIAAAVPDLLARGYRFVRLSDELRWLSY